jgi:hypothetical protein
MSTDESLRAHLQQIRRRANLARDAALALTLENAKESDLPGLIAALQESYTDLLLALADCASRDGTSPPIVKTYVEWPTEPADWPPPPRPPRPKNDRGH